MNAKKLFRPSAIACLSIILFLFGAISVYGYGYADDYLEADSGGSINSESYIAYEAESESRLFIQHSVANEPVVSGTYLTGDMVISPTQPDFDIILSNISGSGSIIIDTEYDGRVLLNNIDISGRVIVADTGGYASLVINNSDVGAIIFDGRGRVVSLPSDGATPAGVVINAPGVQLNGLFNKVESNVDNGIIFFDGRIVEFWATNNVILMGTGDIGVTIAPIGVIVEIFDPAGTATIDTGGLADEIVSRIEALLIYHLAIMQLNLFDLWADIFASLNFGNFNIGQFAIDLPQASPRPARTPRPTATPAPTPYIPTLTPPTSPPPTNPDEDSSGNGNNNGNNNGGIDLDPPVGFSRISLIDFDIMPPNVLPHGLLPAGMQSIGNMQSTIISSEYFGSIIWKNSSGNEVSAFVVDTEYTAVITLLPVGQRYFNTPDIQNSINIALESQVPFSRDYGNETFNWDRIIIRLVFDPSNRIQAGAITLGEIEGDFDEVIVYTHYLGSLSPFNFTMHFGGGQITDFTVSAYNPINGLEHGYYVLRLASPRQPATGIDLTVQMIGTMDFHLPYGGIARITPQPGSQVVDPGPGQPALSSNTSPAGEYLGISNFPQDTSYRLFISPVPIEYAHETMFAIGMHGAVWATINHSQQTVLIPLDAPRNVDNFVYIINMDTNSVITAGRLLVTEPINSLLLGLD